MRTTKKTSTPETPKIKTREELIENHEMHLNWIMERVAREIIVYRKDREEFTARTTHGDMHSMVSCMEGLIKAETKAEIAETILLTVHGGCDQQNPRQPKDTLDALEEMVTELRRKVLDGARHLCHSTCEWRTAEENAQLEARAAYLETLEGEARHARQERNALDAASQAS